MANPCRACAGVCGGQFGDQPHIAGDAFTLRLAAVMLARVHVGNRTGSAMTNNNNKEGGIAGTRFLP